MSDTRDDVLVPRVRPPEALWFPFAVLVLLGTGATSAGIVYLATLTFGLLEGDRSLQWQAVPFAIGMLAMGIGALLGVAALWRRRRRARLVALVVLPLFVAAGAVDGLVVDDSWGLRLNPFVALSLLIPMVACAVFFLPSVRDHYRLLAR